MTIKLCRVSKGRMERKGEENRVELERRIEEKRRIEERRGEIRGKRLKFIRKTNRVQG